MGNAIFYKGKQYPSMVSSGSGGGSNSHTYSTIEQVVGTWIDGKPIYEKTIPIVINPKYTTETIYNISADIPDGECLVDYAFYYTDGINWHNMTNCFRRIQFWYNNSIQYIAYDGTGIDRNTTYGVFQYTKRAD